MQNMKRIGNTDRPVESFEKDEFQIEAYITGLAEFIEECETPMTIAVQGDWGCGKTSMMNMVRQYLMQKNEVMDVWFNTWQFSQFNMDDCLVVTFLQHLIKELSTHLPEGCEEKKEINGKIRPIMKTIAVGMTKHFVGEEIGGMVEGVLEESGKKKETDFADEILELKQSFQKLIRKVAEVAGKRVVVFIDDLDRLQPVRAVELLEVLKLFIDCENCVFVMAIDTSVVFQGIREKYGSDMSHEKAQSFFDKMIQLPFKMPTAYYRLERMLERLLAFLQDETMSVGERNQYISMIREITDGNPRTIKRLANAVLLVDKVAVRRNLYSNEEEKVQSMIRRLLVVLACVQLRYESVYGFLVNNITYGHMKRILDIKIPGRGEANRTELLSKELYNIGLTAKVSTGDYVFYDVMYMFIDLSRDFVGWFKEKGNVENTSIKKLMQVVSLNNIRDISFDEQSFSDVPANSVCEGVYNENVQRTENISTDMMSMVYVGMVNSGRALEAYNLLKEKRVYPRLASNMNYEKNADLKEYRKKRVTPRENYLFCKIDDALRQEYSVEDSNKPEEESRFSYHYSIKYGRYDEFIAHLYFNVEQRSVEFSHNGRFHADTEAFVWCKEFVEEVKKEYKRLQKEYSSVLFPDSELKDIVETRDEDGELQKISVAFGVLSETMAELLIDFLMKLALNPDALVKVETTGGNSWRTSQDLRDVAGMF